MKDFKLRRHALLAALTMVCGLAAAAPISTLNVRAVATPSAEQAAAADERNLLLLTAGIFDPTHERVQDSGLALRHTASSPYVVVQFHEGKVPNADQLRARGFQVLGYLPHNAFQLKVDGAQRSQLSRDQAVRFVGDWQPSYKIAPQLRQGSGIRAPGAVHLIDVYGHFGESTADFQNGARATGSAQVRSETRLGRPFVRLEVSNGSLDGVLAELAHNDQVSWIERFELPQLHNANSIGPIQANLASGGTPPVNAPIWARGILGTGQIVAVTDSGLDRNEGWFNRLDKGAGVLNGITNAENTTPPTPGTLHPDNKVIGYWVMPGASPYDDNLVCPGGTSPTSYHGTHVSGTVAGDSGTAATPTAANYNTGDGMAPNAQILFQDGGNDSTGCLSGLAGPLRLMWEQAQSGGAYISNNSYGSGFAGAYTASDADLDEMAWLNEQFMVVVSAGNAGANGIGHPSHAKHSLSVGALGNGNSTAAAGFSSRGPTADGRRKPDIQAPGSSIVSAGGNDNDDNPPANPNQANTRTLSGTSMSGPTVAGGSALARQYFEDGFYPTGNRLAADSRKPLGAELKAVLLNGTAFIGTGAGATTITPGNTLGWGRIFLDNNLFFPGDSRDLRNWAIAKENGIRTSEVHEYQVQVNAGSEFRATLVWYDPPGTPGAARALVNNLDLEVVTPSDTLLGNRFPTTGSNTQSQTGGSADTVNTVEQVKINAPTAGLYTIRVKGTDVPGNQYRYSSRQGYALVTSQATVATSVTTAPAAPLVNVSGGNVVVSTTSVAGASSYQFYRANGSCATALGKDFQFVGQSSTTSFNDDGTQGGFSYAYKVRGADSGGEGPISACTDILSTTACTLQPNFNATTLRFTPLPNSCSVDLSWDPGTVTCPTASSVRYNVYRSTDPLFIPSASNRIASNLSATAYSDIDTQPLVSYYYAVRAEDDTTGNSGPNGGNESPETHRGRFTPVGSTQTPGTFFDGADSPSFMAVQPLWSVTNAHAATGSFSYRNAPHGAPTYSPGACYAVTTPPIELQTGSAPVLTYKTRYAVEINWDGVVSEISTDGGTTWQDLPPDGGYPATLALTQGNGCGYPTTQGVFAGSTSGAFVNRTRSLTSFAGQTIQVRWRFTSDGAAEEEGFYLDDVQVTNGSSPAACGPPDDLFEDGFED